MKIAQFKPEELSGMVWACAVMAYGDGPLLTSIAFPAIHRMSMFAPRNIAGIAWAMATLGFVDEPLMDVLSHHAVRHLSCVRHPNVAAQSTPRKFRPQELSMTAWAFATLRVIDHRLMAAIAVNVIAHRNEFATQELSNTVWSYATLAITDGPLLAVISAASMLKIS